MATSKEYKHVAVGRGRGKFVFGKLLRVAFRAPLLKSNLTQQELCVSSCAARSQYWFPGIPLDVQSVTKWIDFSCSFGCGWRRGGLLNVWCCDEVVVALACDLVWWTNSRARRGLGAGRTCVHSPPRDKALPWANPGGTEGRGSIDENKDSHGFLLEQLQPVPLMDVQKQKLAA